MPSKVRRRERLQGHLDLYVPLLGTSLVNRVVLITPAVGKAKQFFTCQRYHEHCLAVAARGSRPNGVHLLFSQLVSSVFIFFLQCELFVFIVLLIICLSHFFLTAFLCICSGFVHVLHFSCINHLWNVFSSTWAIVQSKTSSISIGKNKRNQRTRMQITQRKRM